MGLWLKCPKCQAANPLDLKTCTACNASLENLPADQRVYILGDAAPAAPAAPKAAAPEKAAPTAKKVAAPKKAAAAAPKKAAAAKTKAAPEEVSMEVLSSTEPPRKRAKGPKGAKKRK